MVDYRVRDLRGDSRRNFLKLVGAAGAAFGLQRSRVLDYVMDTGGSAMASTMCSTTNRSVHVIGGNGSFAWFQLLWPHVEVAQASAGSGFAYHSYDVPGSLYTPPGSQDTPFYYAPEAPWMQNGMPTRPMSAFWTGKNETHTQTPVTPANIDGDPTSPQATGMLATVASIQRSNPCLLPVIGMQPFNFGGAPGAPAVATVPSADGMVDLFNSTASQLVLSAAHDKALFETYYKAVLSLRDRSGRPTWANQIQTSEKAANLLGLNLAAQLTPTAADLTAYGIDALNAGNAVTNAKAALTNFGKALITTARAFKLGLTNSVIIGLSPGLVTEQTFTDPHQAFNDMTSMKAAVAAFGMILNQFYADLATAKDPSCTAKTLDKSTIFTVHGDTPHNPLQASAWPDATPDNSNWMYVMGNDYLATGWFGSVHADGTTDGYDPTSGAQMPGKLAIDCTLSTGAAVAYAVAKGDIRTVNDFYKGPALTGIIKPPPP